MSASPFSEGKVFFATEFTGPLHGLIARMASAGNVSVGHVRRLIRTSPNLEMYLPIAEHRSQWSGGPDYLVATVLEEGATPYGVSPDGEQVTLSAEAPPSTPTVVLVPAEGFTADGEPREGFISSEVPEPSFADEPFQCADCSTGGGGWSPPSDATWQRDIGIRERISHLRYHDQNEGWPNGQPEFYILLAGTDDTNSDAELTKRIEIPDGVWDNYDHQEDDWVLRDQDILLDWDDYGDRIRIQCMESDVDWNAILTVSGETDIGGVADVQFQADFDIGNSDDNCANGYVIPQYSDGSWSLIPDGVSPEFDGTSDLQWYGYGIDVTP